MINSEGIVYNRTPFRIRTMPLLQWKVMVFKHALLYISIYLSVLSPYMSNASMTANASIGSQLVLQLRRQHGTEYYVPSSYNFILISDHTFTKLMSTFFFFNVMFCCTDTHSATFGIHWLIMWLQPTEQPQEVTCFVGWQKFSNARFYRNDNNGVLLVFLTLLLTLPLLINPMRLDCWEI